MLTKVYKMSKKIENIVLIIFLLCTSACTNSKNFKTKSDFGKTKPKALPVRLTPKKNLLMDVVDKSKIVSTNDIVLNEIYDVLKNELDRKEFLNLQKTQRAWLKSRETALEDDLKHIKEIQDLIKAGDKHLLECASLDKDFADTMACYVPDIRYGGWSKTLSRCEWCYGARIHNLFVKYKSFIKKGLFKKLKSVENETKLSDGLRYAISWFIFYENLEKNDERRDPTSFYGDRSLELGKNLTATFVAPNVWLWIGRFTCYHEITNRHGGVIEFFLIDLNKETIAQISIHCEKKFADLAFYNNQDRIEATEVSSIQKHSIALDVIDYRYSYVVEERIWLVFDQHKNVMEVTGYEKYPNKFL